MEGAEVDLGAEWKEIGISHVPDTIWTRCFQRAAEGGGHLNVLVSAESHGLHLSISHRTNTVNALGNHMPGRLPTWDEIKDARYRFLPDDKRFAMILPPKGEYVNVHATALHVWEMQEGEVPA